MLFYWLLSADISDHMAYSYSIYRRQDNNTRVQVHDVHKEQDRLN